MRNEKSFALPVEFTWKRARAGYRWHDTAHGRLLYAVDALQPDWQNPFERYETTYRPLEERTGLFREFAALELNEQRVAAFADRFGLLGAGSHVQLESPYGPVAVYAEPFHFWKDEIEAFKLALEAWDAVAAASSRALEELGAKLATPSLPLAMRRTIHLDDEDPAMAALSVVQRLADDRLRERIETRLRFSGSSPRLNVSLGPTNLIGALWLQFAAAVDGLKSFNRCSRCGAPFEVSRDPRTGKRHDARFCSSRCRVGHYRDRIEQARRMRSNGTTAEKIAHELNARVATVRGWLAGVQEPAPKAPRAATRRKKSRPGR
jgi:hypothetical protein